MTMEKELITLIISTKNSGLFLPRLFRSLKEQEGPYEAFIIDCLSTDDTLDLAKEFGARIVSEQDNSICEAWDKGARNAKGSILCTVSSDDYLMPNALKIVRSEFEKSATSWVIGMCMVIRNGELYSAYGDGPITIETMLEKNLVPAPSSFFTKEAFLNVSGFDTGLKACQDYDLWMRFLRSNYKPTEIPECLAAINVHGDNFSVQNPDIMKSEVKFIRNKYRL